MNLTTGSNNVHIANPGQAGDAGTIRIGTGAQTATFIAGISGTPLGGVTQPVVVNSNGKLGVAPAAAAGRLGVAEGRRLMAAIKRQQRQIDRLRRRFRSSAAR